MLGSEGGGAIGVEVVAGDDHGLVDHRQTTRVEARDEPTTDEAEPECHAAIIVVDTGSVAEPGSSKPRAYP